MLGIVPVVAVNVAVKEPAVTVIVPGTVNAAALLVNATLAPPAGAARVSVMVQVPVVFCPILTGVQLSDETCPTVVRLMLVVADVLL